jgi:CSLREA domain-containing protein
MVGPGTLQVNTTDDGDDGVCDASHCSLREAIHAANVTSGPDTISFAIPAVDSGCAANGVCTIRPSAALPPLEDDGTTIDGFTQAGAHANTKAIGQAIDTALKIVLDGAQLPACCPVGVSVYGSDNTVRGLVVHGFYSGLEVLDGSRNHIEGNFIGTDFSGVTAVPNRCSGIVLSRLGETGNPSENTVGGATPAARNLVSGNLCSGIEVGAGERHVVLGNYIGVDSHATGALPNQADGVRLFSDSSRHQVGGTGAGEGNLIAFNDDNGVEIDGNFGAALRISLRGNRIRDNGGRAIRLLAGANGGIAAPVITSAGTDRVSGSACASCSVDLYSDDSDEAAIYEGTALADAGGVWSFVKAAGLAGPQVTAAATDSLGNTSELSSPIAVGATATPSATAGATSTPTTAVVTATATATATPSASATRSTTPPTATATGTAPTIATSTPPANTATPQLSTPTPHTCPGDCDGDGAVSIAELIRGVNIALARTALTTCPSFDRDGNAAVGIGELILAVRAALHGCTTGAAL